MSFGPENVLLLSVAEGGLKILFYYEAWFLRLTRFSSRSKILKLPSKLRNFLSTIQFFLRFYFTF